MAVPTDPGFGAGFDAEAFRKNITSVMQMGKPNASAEQATFKWPVNKTYTGPVDPSGTPYDLSSAVTSTNSHEDVKIECAVEFVDRAGDGTAIGDFNNPRAILTILDEEYVKIDGATQVLLGGNTYDIKYVAPPVGLFSVTVYSIHAEAVDES